MTSENLPTDATLDQIERRAEELRVEREQLLDRARALRADHRTIIRAVTAIATDLGLPDDRRLVAVALAGGFPAWRLGGAKRGLLMSTLAHVEAWLRSQPVAVRARRVQADSTTPSAAVTSLDRARRRLSQGAR